MKIVAILQARMGSTRLPGKMLLPLLDKPLVQQVVERVCRAERVDLVVTAVPLADHDSFAFLSASHALYDYPGPEADLVGRYLHAADAFDADVIVRVPCDNPCVDPAYLDAAITDYLTDPYLYYSNTTAWVGPVAIDGIGGEVFSRSLLQWIDQKVAHKPIYREHPHRYFEERGMLRLPPAQLRLDVNSEKDYNKVRDLYAHFGHNHFTALEIVQYLLPQGDPYESCTRK